MYRGLVRLYFGIALAWQFDTPSPAKTLEAYGDSLTAGFLSKTDVTNPPPLDEVSEIINDFVNSIIAGDPALFLKHIAQDEAWPVRLSKLGQFDSVENYATVGATSAHLITQIPMKKVEDAVAVFFVGHNDLIQNENTANQIAGRFSVAIKAALGKWDENHKKSTAYLVPVADIHRVYQSLAGTVWFQGKKKNYRCEDSWQYFRYGYYFYKLLKNNTIEEHLKPRIDAMNDALAVIEKKWEGKNDNRAIYLSALRNVEYKPSLFAIDCFHLSKLGEQTIADLLNFALLK